MKEIKMFFKREFDWEPCNQKFYCIMTPYLPTKVYEDNNPAINPLRWELINPDVKFMREELDVLWGEWDPEYPEHRCSKIAEVVSGDSIEEVRKKAEEKEKELLEELKKVIRKNLEKDKEVPPDEIREYDIEI